MPFLETALKGHFKHKIGTLGDRKHGLLTTDESKYISMVNFRHYLRYKRIYKLDMPVNFRLPFDEVWDTTVTQFEELTCERTKRKRRAAVNDIYIYQSPKKKKNDLLMTVLLLIQAVGLYNTAYSKKDVLHWLDDTVQAAPIDERPRYH